METITIVEVTSKESNNEELVAHFATEVTVNADVLAKYQKSFANCTIHSEEVTVTPTLSKIIDNGVVATQFESRAGILLSKLTEVLEHCEINRLERLSVKE